MVVYHSTYHRLAFDRGLDTSWSGARGASITQVQHNHRPRTLQVRVSFRNAPSSTALLLLKRGALHGNAALGCGQQVLGLY